MFAIRNNSGHTAHWIAIAGLASAIGGLCWYGYPTLRQAPAILAQLPGLQQSLERVNVHLAAAEARIKDWGRSQQEIQDHLAKLDKETASRFQAARKQVQGLRAEVGRVRAEVAAEEQGVETEVAQLESTRSADRANLDQLQAEVASLREESLRQAELIQDARGEIERERAIREQQLASLSERIGRESRDAEEAAKKLAVRRFEFEVTRNHNQELAGGVSLDITGTDVSYRRVTGWMWVMPDRRAIWLRGQGAQQPVVFYGYQDGKRRELVITNVTRDSVTGYLLLPGDDSAKMTPSLSTGE